MVTTGPPGTLRNQTIILGVDGGGEYIVENGYRFTVVEASERTIIKLRVEPESIAGANPPAE